MDEDEKIGLLWHASTGGTFTAMYPYTEEWLYSNEPTYTDQDGGCYVPMYHSIISDHVTTYLHNVNGTPDTLIYENNAFQEIAESARLGIPVVLSCDRSYNTWAGRVNMPNYAVGIAHDEELLYDLVAQYAKEERAIGFHLPFHSYGVEIGSWYGDEVNYIAKMVGIETKAYQENGVNATTKHFVARIKNAPAMPGTKPRGVASATPLVVLPGRHACGSGDMASEGYPIALAADLVDGIARVQQGGVHLRFRFGDDAGADEAATLVQMLFQRRGQQADHGGQDIGHREIELLGKALEQVAPAHVDGAFQPVVGHVLFRHPHGVRVDIHGHDALRPQTGGGDGQDAAAGAHVQ